MKESNRKHSRGTGAALTFIIGILLVMLLLPKRQEALPTTKFNLQEALSEKEQLIDYVISEQYTYAIVSTTVDKIYGDRFLVLAKQENVWKRIYENDFSGLKPWKLEVADVDGDGKKDIITAVRKKTYYDKEEKNRLFLFNYLDKTLVKKWTGSDIAGNWENFVVGELVDTKGEELIFISKTAERKKKLFVYHWFDFGFLLLAEGEAYEDIIEVEILKENCLLLTYQKGKEQKELLRLKEGKVTEVRN